MARKNVQQEDARSPDAKRRKPVKRVRGIKKIRKTEVGPFTQRLAAMLDAGLPLVQSLEALLEQTENEDFRNIVADLRDHIEGGDSFAEALKIYRRVFGDLYISMIQAGEMSGGLAEVTSRLAEYIEASAAIRRRIISAMTYPVMVLGLSLTLTAGMILFIVPKFASMYEDFDSALPAPTQKLVDLSDWSRSNFLLIIGIAAAAVYTFKYIKSTEKGGYLWDRSVLRFPIAGPLIYKIIVGRLARMFASLTRSGVGILDVFQIVSEATGNRYLTQALETAQRDVEAGSSIGQALRGTQVFPPMFIHMINAGEKTGNVDGMLEKVADFYEDEVGNTLEALSSTIEPLLMAVLGILIGGIAICMFLPIFNLGNIVG
ncbi:MAG: type II secretion system F family protein [Verrucomicrobiota bacterium]